MTRAVRAMSNVAGTARAGLRAVCSLRPLTSATFVLMGLSVVPSAEAQWPTKEFTVVSAVDMPGATGLLLQAFNPVAEQLDAWLTAWGMDPTGARFYEPDDEVKREIEDYLSEAATVLEGWGFPPPVLPEEDGRYQVVLALETPAALSGGSAAGTYHPQVCGLIGGVLFFSANAILVDGSGENGKPTVTTRGRSTLAHELFHAVQANTQYLGGFTCPPGAGSWIIEGTARAIGLDVLRVLRSQEVPNWVEAWGGRDYSRRLPVPLRIGPPPAQWTAEDVAGYDTSSLWRYLAEYHAARTVGGGWPGPDHPGRLLDYSYLAFMLEQGNASTDCMGSGASCSGELRWLERGIDGWFGRTLREIYPRFAEVLALYGNHRLSLDATGRQWRTRAFGDCPYVELTPSAQGRVHHDVISSFEPVSMQCWTILVNEFNDDVPVEVAVQGPPGGSALADLSIALAGPPIWADTAIVREAAGGAGLMVRWVVNTSPNGGNYVVLTNVARDPVATTRMQNLPITFTALEPYATITSMTGSGGSNDITTGPGPSGADVDQPIGIQFDRGLNALVMDIVPERYPGVPTGLEQPCGLNTNPNGMRRGDPVTGEMLVFGMWHEGPIAPGEYPVHPHPGPESARPVGTVGVTFTLPLGNPMTDRPTQSFHGTGGVLTIESVSGGFVRGELQVVGENILAVDARHYGWDLEPCSAINPDPCLFEQYIPNAAIRVEFGLPVRSFSFPNRDAVAACLVPSKPEPGATSTPGPGPDPTPDPDPDPDPDPVPDPDLGAPEEGDPDTPQDAGGNPEGDPAPRNPSGDAAVGTGRSLVLEFLADGEVDLLSDPQPVSGSATRDRIAVQSDGFVFRMALDAAEVGRCRLSQGATELLGMLGSGRLLRGGLHLDSEAGDLEVRMTFDEGHIVVRSADPGSIQVTGDGSVIRVDLSGGNLALERDEVESCGGIIDLSFSLTEAR